MFNSYNVRVCELCIFVLTRSVELDILEGESCYFLKHYPMFAEVLLAAFYPNANST